MRIGRRTVVVLMVFAALAAACGGRLDEEQIRAELAADNVGGGSSGSSSNNSGGGTGTSTDDFTSDGDVDGTSATLPDGTSSGGTSTGGGTSSGGGTSTGGGTSSGGGTSTGDGTGGTTGGGGGGTPAPPAPAGGNGGATDVGVTDTEIRIGNVSTLSGPVPGLFRGALVGTQAAFAYQNSLGGLFGRQFVVVSGDDAFDAGQNRARHEELADKVFAFVGSFSLFDFASVPPIDASGVVDVGRSLAISRQDAATSFTPLPFQVGWPSTGCKWLKARFGNEVIQKMAIFWGNADAARNNAFWQRQACEKEGFKFIYERELQATETNFTGDVLQMRNQDVQGFFIVFDVSGIARFFKSIDQQNFDPPLQYPSPAAYDSDLVKLAGAKALEGAIIGQNLVLYLGEDADSIPEVRLFLDWMAKVDPNQKVDIFAVYAWLSARLLIQSLEATGPEALRTKVVTDLQTNYAKYNNFGVSEAANVSGEKAGFCENYMEIRNGKFVRLFPTKPGVFHCDGAFTAYTG